MTLYELKAKYQRLSNEVDLLAGAGERNDGKLLRLLHDLDQVHGEMSELRRRTFAAPTLRDEVALTEPLPPELLAA